MSKFRTVIPVDLSTVTKLLPPGSTVENVDWDDRESCISIIWRNGCFRTPVDFPISFSQEELQAKRAPMGVKVMSLKAPEQQKVLTQSELSPKTRSSEKVAGKIKKPSGNKAKGVSRHPTAEATAVDGGGPGPVERVLAESNG